LDDSEFILGEMLNAALGQHQAKAQAKNLPLSLVIEPGLPETMMGDAPRLRELLSHLVGNAVKFTHSGKVEIHVRAETEAHTGPTRPLNPSETREGPAEAALSQQRSVVRASFSKDRTGPTRPSELSETPQCPAESGSVVRASSSKDPQQDMLAPPQDYLAIEVRDTGIGIAPGQLELIFQSFQQGQRGLTRSYPGLGLGLALARKLAAVMNGEIGVESQLGVGSTFTARLPLRRAVAERGSRGPWVTGSAGPAILAVDDNLVGLTVLRHALQREGMQVDCAASGREALDAASRRRYDLVLMDLQMPEMDGLTAADELRKVPGYEDVPILALTANFSDEVRDECRAHGMQAYLSKPVEAGQLFATVSRYLKR
jgi:CheY-like chemotaxis protein